MANDQVRIYQVVRKQRRRKCSRQGAYLVLFALSMTVLLGFLALIHDLALINYGWRQCQNAADAAALAGARKLGSYKSPSVAKNTAYLYLTALNQTDSSIADIHSPPISGPHAGQRGYVQVTARKDITTWMLRSSWFSSPSIVVTAQSVAGDEAFIPEPSLIALNPNARPGLTVSNTAIFKINGRIVVNSEGGGLTENNTPINNSNSPPAIGVNIPSSGFGLFADFVDAVGGVDNPSGIKPYVIDGYPPLRTGTPAQSDPYLSTPTPSIENGVDSRFRGSVTVTSSSVNGLSYDSSGQNRIAQSNESVANGLYVAQAGDVILHPGVYSRIWVTGGRVYFVPGIYVLTARVTSPDVLRISGGNAIADGTMLYVTGENYDANTGSPDKFDLASSPPSTPTTTFGTSWITTALRITPVDTKKYNYQTLYQGAKTVSSDFNGFSFYQRRHNPRTLLISGNSNLPSLPGVFYGKWMNTRLSIAAPLSTRFVVSDMVILGGSSVELKTTATGSQAIARSIFLVE